MRLAAMGTLVGTLAGACSIATDQRRFQVNIEGTDAVLFVPSTLTVPVGATVVWQNRDQHPHAVTCDPALAQEVGSYSVLPPGVEPWNSGTLYTGETWSHTFTTSGKYLYFSRSDEGGVTIGTIMVS